MKNITNITNIGDPFALKVGNKYYIYATSSSSGFMVWESEDLNTFSEPKLCYEKNATSFGDKDFWAPEVALRNGKFIMHYTAWSNKLSSRRIGVAIANSPTGPFLDATPNEPMFDFGYAAIDANVLIDGDKNYLYYVRDCSENTVDGKNRSDIYVAELSDDLISLKSDGKLVIYPTEPYEIIDMEFDGVKYNWNEGPLVLKRNGLYYMMYSANFFESPKYCICVAVSKYPDKEFTKYDKPALEQIKGVISGPGHNSVVEVDGQLYCCYHIHTSITHPSGDRTICFSPMKFKNDKLIIDFM